MTARCSRRRRAAGPLLALVLLAGACGGSDGTEPSDSTAAAAEARQAPTDTAEPTPPAAAEEEPTNAEPTATVAAEEEPASTEPTATATAQVTSTTPTAVELALGSFELIEPGAYAVGVTTIEVIDAGRSRPLTVDVWFPLAEEATGDLHQYTLLPGTYFESPSAVTADAASISSDGPFPLIMYSHGSGGLRYIHSSYTEAIASHGYVVMAPDHTGNTALERLTDSSDPGDVIALNRPLDISAVIDAALDSSHPTAGVFASSIDAENIAVTGHSFGGYTTYALAAGVTIDGTEITPDPRIDALIALAPATGAALLTDDRLASVTIPSMIIVGTDDKTTPVDPNVDRPWELSPASPHFRIELSAAEHQTFTNLCQYQDFMPMLENVPELILTTINDLGAEGCSAGDMPIERAVELTNTLAIGFLDAVLRDGDPFDPTTIELPEDITVQVK